MRILICQFIHYLLIGVINTLVGYGVIFGLMYSGMDPFGSNMMGYGVGVMVSYALNRRFNFKSRVQHREAFPKFICAMGIAYSVNIAVLYVAVNAGIDAYISQIIAGIFYTATGFMGSKFLAFKERRPRGELRNGEAVPSSSSI
ncbi:MAG: GtrA family protein [Thermoproteota archaeon]